MNDPRTTQIDGASLVPDFDSHAGRGVTTEYAYWMGLTPACPAHQINVAGLNFPKMNEILIQDPNRTGKRQRIPVIGGLDKGVNSDHIAALRAVLPRLVVRFTEAAAGDQIEETGSGQNIGDVHVRVRKGFIITIPTAEAIAQAKADGRQVPRYIRKPGDEPAARYMYFKLCENQGSPLRGNECPPSIEEAGIFWPEELAAATAELLA